MLLNNYYQWLNVITHNSIVNNAHKNIPVAMYDFYKGDVQTLSTYGFIGVDNSGVSNNDLTCAGQVYLSDTQVAPSKTDYNFPALLTSTITNLNYTFAHSYDSVKGLVRTITITGTASSNCTIRQVGYGKKLTTSYGSVTAYPVLMAKWVLPDPLTLTAGEGFTITVEWDEGEA